MNIRAFCKKEKGDVAVVVALSLTVLFGFTAFAVDFGMLAEDKQSLQNAADAAALAAAADLGAGRASAVIRSTAEEYCRANDVDPSDSRVTFDVQTVGKDVTVTLSRSQTMGFSAVLTGENERSVSASATAQASSIFGGCPYAMFAGRRIEESGTGIDITGNDIQINGNIHSNSDISMQHAVLGPGAMATAVRNVSPSTTGWNGNSIALDMPSFSSFERALSGMPEVVEFSGSVVKNSKTGFQELINEALVKYWDRMGSDTNYLFKGLFIHVAGDLIFNGHTATAYTALFPIILVVDGNIDLNGATLNSAPDFPVYVMSKNGNITVNGGGATFTGILFAPKGNVTLNGNNAEFVGSIVAQNIRKAGGKIIVRYCEDVDRFLPKTKVRLIA